MKPSDCKDDEFFNASILQANGKLPGDCASCPLGGSCVGDITDTDIRALFGWSQCPNQSLTYERCVFGAACLGAPNPALKEKFKINNSDVSIDLAMVDSISACAPPYLGDGLICSSCASGYSRSSSVAYRCDKCPTDEGNTGLAVTISILGIIGLVGYVLLTLSDAGKLQPADGAIAIGVSYVQVVSLLLTFPIAW